MPHVRIFSPDDKDKLRSVKRDLSRQLDTLADAEECGIECQSRRERIQDALDVLNQIETKFMSKL
jgi:hypothetical protein